MRRPSEFLDQYPQLADAALAIVWLCAAFLLLLGAVSLLRPSAARRFMDGFAASPFLNFLEALLRLVAGLSFVGASPEMRLSDIFLWFGVVLAATAIPMMFLYSLHKRYAGWAIPLVKRMLPLYGLLSLALGGFIVWALA